jgi:tRNA(fMet)-specific endonuclease VapC
MILLDTEPMTVLEREGPEAERLKARLANVPLDDVATTIIIYEEQTRGWLAYMARMQTEAARIRAYVFLKRHLEIYCRVAVVQYDAKAAEVFERLKRAKVRIGTMDLKIAAIALANDAILLTRNLSDFSKVPDLKAEDWSA